MPPPLEPLQYKDIMEIWQKEKKTMSLTEVRHDLYPSLRELVGKLERDRETETAKDPYSALSRSLNQQLINLREKAGSIFDFRLEKIFRMAVRGAGGGKVETSRMTGEEKSIFEEVLGRTKGLRGDALGTVRSTSPEFQRMSAIPPASIPMVPQEEGPVQAEETTKVIEKVEGSKLPVAHVVEVLAPVAAQPPMAPLTVIKEEPEPAPKLEKKPGIASLAKPAQEVNYGDLVLLRVLEDIPPFAGPNGTYRLGREDVVTLPASIGRALVKRGKAVEIVPGRT